MFAKCLLIARLLVYLPGASDCVVAVHKWTLFVYAFISQIISLTDLAKDTTPVFDHKL